MYTYVYIVVYVYGYIYIYIHCSRICSFCSKTLGIAAELPIDDEMPHENMPAEGTAKVARLVAMAKGFLPKCKVQGWLAWNCHAFWHAGFPKKSFQAWSKAHFLDSISLFEKCREKDNHQCTGAVQILAQKEKSQSQKLWKDEPRAAMQVLKVMGGNSVQAGMASKPGKRLTKKTPQPEEGSTQKESSPTQPACKGYSSCWERKAAKACLKVKWLPRSAWAKVPMKNPKQKVNDFSQQWLPFFLHEWLSDYLHQPLVTAGAFHMGPCFQLAFLAMECQCRVRWTKAL